MKANNFNTNANGPDIEITCFYDTSLSQMLFNENFQILQNSSYRETCKAYYIDNGNVPDADSLEFTLKGSKEDKVKYLKENDLYGYESLDALADSELSQEIIGYLSERPSIHNLASLNRYDLANTGLEIVPSKNIVWVSVRGYSQGDYAEVAYCPDDLKEAWGTEPNESELRKLFAQLFYDTPIYACLTIDGEEYRYDETTEDSYTWDKKAWAKVVSEQSKVDYETILEMLPSAPDYL